jgi:ParB family chromosome partitioning protein
MMTAQQQSAMPVSTVAVCTQLTLLPDLVEPVRKTAAFYQRDAENSTDEWYTPVRFIEAARAVLGDIDLDPASSTSANLVVQARRYFTVDNDGLSQEWHGRVWLNPPYSDTKLWVDKLVAEYTAGRVSEAVLTIFANTSTQYFKPLWHYTLCFPVGRIKFINRNPAKDGNSATKDSVFVYLGPDDSAFRREFRQFGPVGMLR